MAAALGFLAPPLIAARSTVAADAHRLAVPSRLPQRAGHALGTAVMYSSRSAYCTPHAPREETLDRTRHPPADPRGFRVRLLETDGRGVRLGLRCFRAVASARKINPGDVPPVELGVDGDRVEVHVGPHQWIEVEVLFQP